MPAKELSKALGKDLKGIVRAAGCTKHFKKYSYVNEDGKTCTFSAAGQIIFPFEKSQEIARKLGREAILQDHEPVPWHETEVQLEGRLPRPPVVVVAGHVDHGKTTLLDALRGTDVAATEVAGITQRVSAFEVETTDAAGATRSVTFIDTPGHQAFFQMRANSTVAADIVLLMVALDEGVREQTREVLETAAEVGVPVVVALNKVDLVDSGAEAAVRQALDRAGRQAGIADWRRTMAAGVVPISARGKTNLPALVSALAHRAEVEGMWMHPDQNPEATVFEARMGFGEGVMFSVIVHAGVLRTGQWFVYNTLHGRVKTLYNQAGEAVDRIEAGRPAVLLGMKVVGAGVSEVPLGQLLSVRDKDEVRQIQRQRQYELAYFNSVEQADGEEEAAEAPPPPTVQQSELDGGDMDDDDDDVPIVLKANTSGALVAFHEAIEADVPGVKVVLTGVGKVGLKDVAMASSLSCPIFCFNTSAAGQAARKAKAAGVAVRGYDVYYNLLDDVAKHRAAVLEAKAQTRARKKERKQRST